MILNVSHNDPEIKFRIKKLVGAPFPLIARLKMKRVGSPKLLITKASLDIQHILNIDQSTNTCNIELRPFGIIIGFQKRLETYNLVIPYYKLTIYKGSSDEYTFFKDQHFIRVLVKSTNKTALKFINEVISNKQLHAEMFSNNPE